jgi:thioredoxin-like negative regulator of GroEL
MPRCRLTAPLLVSFFVISLFVCPAVAQLRTGNLKVRITFTNGHPCSIRVMVQLMLSAGSTSVAENYTNDEGMTDFNDVEVGNYHLIVTGEGIEHTDSGLFEVDSRRGTQYQTVSVRRTDEVSNANGPGSSVAVQDMNIPKAARKQFDKASDLIANQEWKKALERLNQALALYPGYAQAYNNLGVVYGRMGDRDAERAALQKAVNLNDHFAPAWVNLARMAIVDRDFRTAQGFLDKASALTPTDSMTLLILANVQLLNLRYDDAIATCHKVHSLGQDSHSLVHFIAARALEHQSRLSDAEEQLHTFLQEEPSGVRADAARKELASLRRQTASHPAVTVQP